MSLRIEGDRSWAWGCAAAIATVAAAVLSRGHSRRAVAVVSSAIRNPGRTFSPLFEGFAGLRRRVAAGYPLKPRQRLGIGRSRRGSLTLVTPKPGQVRPVGQRKVPPPPAGAKSGGWTPADFLRDERRTSALERRGKALADELMQPVLGRLTPGQPAERLAALQRSLPGWQRDLRQAVQDSRESGTEKLVGDMLALDRAVRIIESEMRRLASLVSAT